MGSHSKAKGHGGKAVMDFIDKFYEQTPGFQDVFDEETFYIFAGVITLITILAAFLASRYITIKPKDWRTMIKLIKTLLLANRNDNMFKDVTF